MAFIEVKHNIRYTAPICFGYSSWLGDATVMTYPRNEHLTLNTVTGVAQLF